MSKSMQTNEWLSEVQEQTHEWRLETIGDDITALSQAAHTAVEAAEVLDLFVKDETYDGRWVDVENRKHVPGGKTDIMEELGDVVVAHLGTMSLLGADAGQIDVTGRPEWIDESDGPLVQATELLHEASLFAVCPLDGFPKPELQDRCEQVIQVHGAVVDSIGLDLYECIEAALEKNGARDWIDHKEGSA